jgi:periplasmic protein TonB
LIKYPNNMKKITLITSLLALCFSAKAQSNNPEKAPTFSDPIAPVQQGYVIDTANPVFTYVEQMPRFPGDSDSLLKFLNSTVRYPDEARSKNIQGRVVVKFVVDKDGSITNPVIVRGIGGGCDEEAIRLINAMPKWTPGYHNGKAVRVYYTLPISFKLGK